MWDWLLQQAQTASPFVAVFSLTMLGAVTSILWRTHVKDQATILAMAKSQGEAMTQTAVAMERLSGSIREATSRGKR